MWKHTQPNNTASSYNHFRNRTVPPIGNSSRQLKASASNLGSASAGMVIAVNALGLRSHPDHPPETLTPRQPCCPSSLLLGSSVLLDAHIALEKRIQLQEKCQEDSLPPASFEQQTEPFSGSFSLSRVIQTLIYASQVHLRTEHEFLYLY